MQIFSKAFHPLKRFFVFKITPAGRYLIGAMFLTSCMGILNMNVPIFHLSIGLFYLFIATLFAAFLFKPRVNVTVEMPEKVSVSQVVEIKFKIKNRSRIPAFDIAADIFALEHFIENLHESAVINQLSRNEESELDLTLVPRKRGIYELKDADIFSSFPFNLWRKGTRCPMKSLTVFPQYFPLTSINMKIGSRYQPGGMLFSSNTGESPEYIGNREYRSGDMLRKIDFKSWARLTKPTVKEYHEEYYCRIALVLDTFVDPRLKKGPYGYFQLEGAVSLAASIAEYISEDEFILDIFAVGPELYTFRSGRSIAHFENVLEVLSCVEECAASPFEDIAPDFMRELDNITSVIFVLLDWDDERENFVKKTVESNCYTKAVIVRSRETTNDLKTLEECVDSFTVVSPEYVRNGTVENL